MSITNFVFFPINLEKIEFAYFCLDIVHVCLTLELEFDLSNELNMKLVRTEVSASSSAL